MKRTGTFVLALALAGCQPPASPEAVTPTARTGDDSTTARAFLTHIYAGYYPDAPLEAILPDEQVYAVPLLTAMEANSEVHDGEVGYLDGDPLCDCQDNTQDLRAIAFNITPQGNGRLRATANQPLKLDLTLVREGDGWRIGDIATADAPSLLQALERDTAEATSGGP